MVYEGNVAILRGTPYFENFPNEQYTHSLQCGDGRELFRRALAGDCFLLGGL